MENQDQHLATLTDIVFEHRNRAYGAFELRKSYSHNVNKAVIIGVSLFLMAIISPMLFAEKIKIVDKGFDFVLNPEAVIPQQKEKKIVEPKIEKQQVETKRFVEIKVVPPTEVIIETTPPTQEELKDAVIGSQDIKGNPPVNDFVAAAPPIEASSATRTVELTAVDEPMIVVEIQPSFAGGNDEMYKFLSKNLKYPSAAQRAGVQGKVFLSFVVEKDGSLSNVQDIKGIGFGCDEEAIRVIKMMPKWNPGRQQGNAVRVRFTLPIFFKLEE